MTETHFLLENLWLSEPSLAKFHWKNSNVVRLSLMENIIVY